MNTLPNNKDQNWDNLMKIFRDILIVLLIACAFIMSTSCQTLKVKQAQREWKQEQKIRGNWVNEKAPKPLKKKDLHRISKNECVPNCN